MKASELLRKADEWLSGPDKWYQGSFMIDKRGISLYNLEDPKPADVARCCALGALRLQLAEPNSRVWLNGFQADEGYCNANQYLTRAVFNLSGGEHRGVSGFNDSLSTGFKDIKDAFKVAIEMAEKDGQ